MRPTKACPVVLREGPRGVELLVFRHPLAGVQLVKGTIEPGEDPAAAALRELGEESGIHAAEIATALGVWASGDPDQIWAFFAVRVLEPLAERWFHFTTDGGGHEFELFWHPLDAEPSAQWHPLFVAALVEIRARSAEASARAPTDGAMTRRPALPDDVDFLRELHHAAYRDVLTRQFGAWDEQQQDQSFLSDLAGSRFEVLQIDGAPIGAVGIETTHDSIRLAELWILPACQGRGLGSSILRDLQEQARAVGVPVRLSVLKANRARALYERHGFVVVGETDIVYRMQWRP